MDVKERAVNAGGRESSEWNVSPETIDRFLSELTELSHLHGIAISDAPQTFVIEREDRDSFYTLDDESRLLFG